jgi:hypothetical protein
MIAFLREEEVHFFIKKERIKFGCVISCDVHKISMEYIERIANNIKNSFSPSIMIIVR